MLNEESRKERRCVQKYFLGLYFAAAENIGKETFWFCFPIHLQLGAFVPCFRNIGNWVND